MDDNHLQRALYYRKDKRPPELLREDWPREWTDAASSIARWLALPAAFPILFQIGKTLGNSCWDLALWRCTFIIAWVKCKSIESASKSMSCCLPSVCASAITLAGFFESVRIHRRKNVNFGWINKRADVIVLLVVTHYILNISEISRQDCLFCSGFKI